MPTLSLPDIFARPTAGRAVTLQSIPAGPVADFAFARAFAGETADDTDARPAAETAEIEAVAPDAQFAVSGQLAPAALLPDDVSARDRVASDRAMQVAAGPSAQAIATMPDQIARSGAQAQSFAETTANTAVQAAEAPDLTRQNEIALPASPPRRDMPPPTAVVTAPREMPAPVDAQPRDRVTDSTAADRVTSTAPVSQSSGAGTLAAPQVAVQNSAAQARPDREPTPPETETRPAPTQLRTAMSVAAERTQTAGGSVAVTAGSAAGETRAMPQVGPVTAGSGRQQRDPVAPAATGRAAIGASETRGQSAVPAGPTAAQGTIENLTPTLPDGLAPGAPEIARLHDPFRPAYTAAPAAALPQETARQIAAQLAVAVTTSGDGGTEIALNPEELGRVRMHLTTTDMILTIAITAERPETADLMRRHIDTLAQEFRDQGYRQVNIDIGGRPDQGAARQDNARPPGSNAGTLAVPTDPAAPPAGRMTRAALPGSSTLDLRL